MADVLDITTGLAMYIDTMVSARLPVISPNKLFIEFESGRMSRQDFHAAMAVHARELIIEMEEARRNPMAAFSEFIRNRRAAGKLARHHGEAVLNAVDFLKLLRKKMNLLQLDESLLKRSVNEGFSGGEKKRAEILQMALLDPTMAVLDETDSGLDIDALKVVANGVNTLKRADNAQLIITHYQRLLDYIVPDFVHVLYAGRIMKSGGKELALELEEKGYDWIPSGELQTA